MSASPPPPPPPLLRDGEGHDRVKDHNEGTAAAKQQPPLPEDGYQWKKYGQKPIKKINMIRSYYRCRSKHCRAKKRVEWPPSNPSDLRIIYDDGNHHSHDPQPPSHHHRRQEAADNSSQYELGNQVFGCRHHSSQ